MYEIILHRRAARFYRRLGKRQRERLNKAIDRLKSNPSHGKDIKKLRGELRGKYRLRVGSFRIVYGVDENKNLVVVESIGPRGDTY